MLENQKKLDKAMLGKLIKMLRSRVVFHNYFEKVFTQYIFDRNALIHTGMKSKVGMMKQVLCRFLLKFRSKPYT